MESWTNSVKIVQIASVFHLVRANTVFFQNKVYQPFLFFTIPTVKLQYKEATKTKQAKNPSQPTKSILLIFEIKILYKNFDTKRVKLTEIFKCSDVKF